jgi:large subunit ribosomal protein L28
VGCSIQFGIQLLHCVDEEVASMAKVCEVCGKGATVGCTVTHWMKRNKRLFRPNIQKVRVLVDGTPQRANVCTRCLRSNRVTRAL